jgi:hypothetical protein
VDGAGGVQLGQPVAFQAVQQPPQDQHPLGPDGIGEAGPLLDGQLVNHCGQGSQPIG